MIRSVWCFSLPPGEFSFFHHCGKGRCANFPGSVSSPCCQHHILLLLLFPPPPTPALYSNSGTLPPMSTLYRNFRIKLFYIKFMFACLSLSVHLSQIPNSAIQVLMEIHKIMCYPLLLLAADYWASQVGLLTPLTFAHHRLSPLAAFTFSVYFLHNGRQ